MSRCYFPIFVLTCAGLSDASPFSRVKNALAERGKIVAEAKREVDRVIEQSRQEIDRVARSVERGIKERIADMAIDRAGNTLRTEIVRFIKKL